MAEQTIRFVLTGDEAASDTAASQGGSGKSAEAAAQQAATEAAARVQSHLLLQSGGMTIYQTLVRHATDKSIKMVSDIAAEATKRHQASLGAGMPSTWIGKARQVVDEKVGRGVEKAKDIAGGLAGNLGGIAGGEVVQAARQIEERLIEGAGRAAESIAEAFNTASDSLADRMRERGGMAAELADATSSGIQEGLDAADVPGRLSRGFEAGALRASEIIRQGFTRAWSGLQSQIDRGGRARGVRGAAQRAATAATERAREDWELMTEAAPLPSQVARLARERLRALRPAEQKPAASEPEETIEQALERMVEEAARAADETRASGETLDRSHETAEQIRESQERAVELLEEIADREAPEPPREAPSRPTPERPRTPRAPREDGGDDDSRLPPFARFVRGAVNRVAELGGQAGRTAYGLASRVGVAAGVGEAGSVGSAVAGAAVLGTAALTASVALGVVGTAAAAVRRGFEMANERIEKFADEIGTFSAEITEQRAAANVRRIERRQQFAADEGAETAEWLRATEKMSIASDRIGAAVNGLILELTPVVDAVGSVLEFTTRSPELLKAGISAAIAPMFGPMGIAVAQLQAMRRMLGMINDEQKRDDNKAPRDVLMMLRDWPALPVQWNGIQFNADKLPDLDLEDARGKSPNFGRRRRKFNPFDAHEGFL